MGSIIEHSLSLRSELSEPCLLISQGDRRYIQRIATKSPQNYEIGNIPALAGKEICSTYYEWMVLKDLDSPDCCLLNLISQERIQLPPVSFRYNFFILTSHPTDPACRVVLYDKNKKALAFCRPGDDKFVRKKTRRFRRPRMYTIAAGKIYFRTHIDGVTSLEFEDSTYCIRKLKLGLDWRDSTDPAGHRSKILWNYLAAYSGELFLVKRYFYENYNNNATGFQVFKADFSKKKWVAVKSIAPLTIFLTEYPIRKAHMCCPTIDSGIKSNAIYFLEGDDVDHYAYCLDEESITMYPTDCVPDDNIIYCSWMVLPHDTHLLQKDDKVEEEEEVLRQDREGTLEEWESLTEGESWASLPPELLSEILSRLHARDYAVIRGVCKSWQQITTQHSLYSPPLILQQEESNVPLLMFLENRDVPVYKLLDPIHRKYQRLEIPELKGADIRYSKHGWLLASRRSDGSLFFLNPLTQEKIELPSQPSRSDINLCFSSPPTSSDCLIVATEGGFVHVSFMTLRRGENVWRDSLCEDEPHKSVFPCSSPVVHNGLHYYACEDRRVVAFDFYGDEIKLVNSWSTCLRRVLDEDNGCDDEDFMVDIDGVPALVIVPRDGEKIDIFKWDLKENDWVKMEDINLGDKDLFLSRRSSFLERVDYGGGMGNKIFLTLVDTDAMDGVFYSLKTQMYHTFYSGYSSEDSYYVAKYHGGIWVEPLYTKSSEDDLTWCSDVESGEESDEESEEESDEENDEENEEESGEERDLKSDVETCENI